MTTKPHCSACGELLYRSAAAGTPVKKDAPRVVCRNADCPGKHPKPKLSRQARRRSLQARPKPPAEATPVNLVELQRSWVRSQLNLLAKGEDENAIALLLALACEETGNPEAAVVLAIKHGLKRIGYTPSGL